MFNNSYLKPLGFSLALGLLGLMLSLPVHQAQAAPKDPAVSADVEKSKPYQRWKWFFEQRAYPTGEIPAGANAKAWKQIKEAKEKAKTAKGGPSALAGTASAASITSTSAGDRWIPIGPKPIDAGPYWGDVSGRVSDIEVDPTDPNHWLVSFALGGLWETRDAGATWAAKTDNEATQAMGAIAMAPSNPLIIYAGTGDPVGWSGGSGAGLLKSTDGGNAWQLLATAQFAGSAFSEIRVKPDDANVLLATTGIGVAKSVNGGTSWQIKLSSTVITSDLEVSPANFDQQYAAGIFSSSSYASIRRSTDAGNAWSPISGPWDQLNLVGGRIEMAIAPSSPNVMYVSASNGNLLGVWRTDNAWNPTPSWTQVLEGGSAYGGQWWYNNDITVDPTNPLVVYFGGVQLRRLNGNMASPIGNIHSDQHNLTWAGNRLIVGNDGGVYSSPNPAEATPIWDNHNAGLDTTTFYHGSLHPDNAGFALGGSQDNGTEKWMSMDRWQMILGADGADNAISSTRPDTNWAISYQGLSMLRTTDGGRTIVDARPQAKMYPFIASFEKCPFNDDIFLAGAETVYRSDNFFSGNPAPLWSANGPAFQYGVRAIAFAPATQNCDTYAFAASDQIRLTRDGGATWTNLDTSNKIPDRVITDIAFDPSNANVMYVTLSGYDNYTTQPGHVFKTSNALSATPTWINISPPVDLPHNTILVDPKDSNILYTGTDLGIWKSSDAGATWTHMGPETGLPNVVVSELQASGNTGKIVAFTYGRSAFMLAPAVDLVATVIEPSRVAPDTLTPLTSTVCNQGYQDAAAFEVHYYQSSDASITTADTYLGSRTVTGLAANRCDSGALAWTSGSPSTVYIGAIVDANDAVPEANEANNTLAKRVVVYTNSDLVVSSVTLPATVAAGSTINIPVQIRNQGSGSTEQGFRVALNYTYFLRSPNTVSLGSATLPPLAAGATADVSITATLPTTLPATLISVDITVDDEAQIDEVDETNNKLYSGFHVTNGADLTVSAITVSSPAAPGNTISVTATVCNNGGGAVGRFSTRTYLSSDSVIDSADITIGESDPWSYVDGLAANTCATYSYTPFTIPADLSPGNYNVIAQADSFYQVQESNEDNNIKVIPIGINLAMANLIPSVSTVNVGTTLAVSNTAQNVGTQTTSSAFAVAFRLSTNAIYGDADDVTITTSRSVTSLAAGASNTVTTSLLIPASTKAGNYYVCAKADSGNTNVEVDENDNSLCSSTQVNVPLPDLISSALTTTATTTAPGATLSLTNAVKNQGGSSAGSFVIAFHLSTDALYGGTDDIAFTTTRTVASLGVGAINSLATTLTVPTTTPLGLYYLCASTDVNNTVAEGSEGNNAACTATQIKVAYPDLTVSALSMTATTANGGGTLAASHTVTNGGEGPAGANTSAFRLSTNTIYGDADDVVITTTQAVAALAPGAVLSYTTNLLIPVTVKVGTYYLCAKADNLLSVAEANEANNSRCTNTTVTLPPPDLIVSAISSTATTGNAGSTVSLSNTVKNQGGSAAGSSIVAFRLSANTVYGDADDILSTTTRTIASLNTGAISTATTSVLIPATTPSGTYYLCANADNANTIVETSEANNTACTSTTITVPLPDLVMTALSTTATSVNKGGSFVLSNTVKNQGGSTASTFSIKFVLSKDDILGNTDDVALSPQRSLTLGVGLSSSASSTVTVPLTAPSGIYGIWAIADSASTVLEINEANNSRKASSGTINVP